jgi:imidazole glycerol-phosphate synthase subunit HisH
MNIAIIDYKMSNMFSIKNALDAIDLKTQITFDHKTILEADGVVLPGVGSFPEAMLHLTNLGLIDLINEFIASGKPFLGICLGFQLLFENSEEFEQRKGLGIIEGRVEKFSSKSPLPVPHVGWNTIIKQKPPKQNETESPSKFMLGDNDYYYFVHSYYVKPDNIDDIYTMTHYGQHEFCSSIKVDNVFGCQFHPEKSGPRGLKFLQNYFS